MQMEFQSSLRWQCEFQGTPWSNKSDENPPEGDTMEFVVQQLNTIEMKLKSGIGIPIVLATSIDSPSEALK